MLVTNMRAAALERLGLGADALRSQHPHLICCRANGYGSGGPYRDKAAYDDAIQAASGLSNLIGRIAGEPGFVPAVVADKVTGLHVVEAVLAALFHRERTGMAQSIEVPMFETMVAFNLVEHYRGAVFEPPEGPFGYDRLLTPHRRPYPTADGWVCLLPYNDAQYRAFFAFVDRPELASDPRFADHNSRIAHIDDLYALFGELSVRRTTDEWIGYCDEHSIPAARVMDLADLDADPQLAAVGLVSIAEHPTEGALPLRRRSGRVLSDADSSAPSRAVAGGSTRSRYSMNWATTRTRSTPCAMTASLSCRTEGRPISQVPQRKGHPSDGVPSRRLIAESTVPSGAPPLTLFSRRVRRFPSSRR